LKFKRRIKCIENRKLIHKLCFDVQSKNVPNSQEDWEIATRFQQACLATRKARHAPYMTKLQIRKDTKKSKTIVAPIKTTEEPTTIPTNQNIFAGLSAHKIPTIEPQCLSEGIARTKG
jgi:hypothetical protein